MPTQCAWALFAIGGTRWIVRWVILPKIAFWLIALGSLALIAPNPAWPKWLAQMALATGIALGITTLGVRRYESRRSARDSQGGSKEETD